MNTVKELKRDIERAVATEPPKYTAAQNAWFAFDMMLAGLLLVWFIEEIVGLLTK